MIVKDIMRIANIFCIDIGTIRARRAPLRHERQSSLTIFGFNGRSVEIHCDSRRLSIIVFVLRNCRTATSSDVERKEAF